ncbi:MAG: TerB N-terminal domain-containing protein [Firmicutes bacterium]|nr:TerB N-terminal domain-containing protein [Bacillota bacterium]
MDSLFSGARFAEIEVDFGPGNTAAAEPIGPRTADPIREKFYQMRSLASGNPFARNDAGLFYKQARFMADFSDDYPGRAPFSMYYPYYQHMGYEQLRTYFTWRTNARRGEILPIALSYVFLYLYELLSGVGVRDPADGLDRLMAVWAAVRRREPMLDGYLPQWIKDYCIYYPLPQNFSDFVAERGLQRYYPELFLFDLGAENTLSLWNGISGYDITKSKFYGAGNAVLLESCFAAVLRGLREACARRRLGLDDLLIYGICRGVTWNPFGRALFVPWLQQPDRRVELPGGEVYTCRDNWWTADITLRYAGRRELVGYLLKKTEACLREAVKYSPKITVSAAALRQALPRLQKLGLPPPELDRVIEKAVADFQSGRNRRVVTVNRQNLARIREEALGTQNRLIVPEEDASQTILSVSEPQAEPLNLISDGWSALKEALCATERAALSVALTGSADIKIFAAQNGVMPEILADGINEKAMDFIGDNILAFAENMAIYEEYRENIAEMLGE